jgi:hypothetical protein
MARQERGFRMPLHFRDPFVSCVFHERCGHPVHGARLRSATAATKREGTVRCALTKKTREETVLGFRGAVAAGEAGSGPQFGADHFGISGRSERRRRWRRCARLLGKRRAFDQHADFVGIEHFAF